MPQRKIGMLGQILLKLATEDLRLSVFLVPTVSFAEAICSMRQLRLLRTARTVRSTLLVVATVTIDTKVVTPV